MVRSVTRLLIALAVIVSTVAFPLPAAAVSDPPSNCAFRYLSTGFGPLTLCGNVTGALGFAAYYSPVTGQYSPATGFLPVEVHTPYVHFGPGSDGQVGTFWGHTSFTTAFGPTVYGIQYEDGYGRGRFGNLNFVTALFYPSSGWLPVAKER
jgi:hypothetical protein